MILLRRVILKFAHNNPTFRRELVPLLRRTAEKNPPDPVQNALLGLFHHIHHETEGEGKKPKHEVHHCGGQHAEVDPTVDYIIHHCSCGLHRIDKKTAIGHGTKKDLDLLVIPTTFVEKCPEGGWHIESGKVSKEHAAKLAHALLCSLCL